MANVMAFRVQGKTVRCVRFTHGARRPGRGILVASFEAAADEIPGAVASVLAGDELEQLQAWFQGWQKTRDAGLLAEACLASGGWLLEDLARLVNDAQRVDAKQGDALWEGVTALAKALRKAGVAKPQRIVAAAKGAGQLDLLDDLA